MTITDVLTIPAADQERKTLKAAEVPLHNQRSLYNGVVVTYQWRNVPPGRQDRQVSVILIHHFFLPEVCKIFFIFVWF